MKSLSEPAAYTTFADLLRALEHEVEDEDVRVTLVEYAEEFVSRDADVFALDWTVEEHGEGVILASPGVQMHTLEPPYTVADWHDYLTELDCRIGRAAAIAEIPDRDELDEMDDPELATLAGLAGVLGVTVDALVAKLGDDWTVIEDHAVGTHTHSDRYLVWRGELVVGIDDGYVHVFSVLDEDGVVCADEVVGWLEWPELEDTLDFAVFVQELRNALAEQYRGQREETALAGMTSNPRRSPASGGGLS